MYTSLVSLSYPFLFGDAYIQLNKQSKTYFRKNLNVLYIFGTLNYVFSFCGAYIKLNDKWT